MQKKNETVILLDLERKYIQRDGEVHVAHFLVYSAAVSCIRICFDRDEIAQVMNATGEMLCHRKWDVNNMNWSYMSTESFYLIKREM